MHAYDAIIPPQVLIPSPIIVPPSPMQSPIFNPQEFFVLEELLPPKEQVSYLTSSSTNLSNPSRKQACILVPPSFSIYTPTPPKIFEIGKSSIKMHLKHHEKQKAPKRTSTSAAPAMTQAAIRQLVTNSVATALEAPAANMADTNNTNRNPEPRETPAARKCT
nr:hypothetical protein [Tanacetum cinerariifolium]